MLASGLVVGVTVGVVICVGAVVAVFASRKEAVEMESSRLFCNRRCATYSSPTMMRAKKAQCFGFVSLKPSHAHHAPAHKCADAPSSNLRPLISQISVGAKRYIPKLARVRLTVPYFICVDQNSRQTSVIFFLCSALFFLLAYLLPHAFTVMTGTETARTTTAHTGAGKSKKRTPRKTRELLSSRVPLLSERHLEFLRRDRLTDGNLSTATVGQHVSATTDATTRDTVRGACMAVLSGVWFFALLAFMTVVCWVGVPAVGGKAGKEHGAILGFWKMAVGSWVASVLSDSRGAA